MSDKTPITIVSSAQFSSEWLRHQEYKRNHPEEYRLISTGLTDLDIALGGGLERGQFMIVGGPPKGGKTTELASFATYMSKKYNCLYATIEMNLTQLGNVMFSSMSGVERAAIRALNIKGPEWDQLYAAGERLGNLNLSFIHNALDVDMLFSAIDMTEKEIGEPLDVVLVDYLQILETDEKNQTVALNNDVRRLKSRTIWPGRELVMIAGSTMNRESTRGKKWDMNGLFGSGAMERYGDVVTIIHDLPDPGNGDRPYTNRKGIDIVASRETANAEVVVGYDPKTARLFDFSIPKANISGMFV